MISEGYLIRRKSGSWRTSPCIFPIEDHCSNLFDERELFVLLEEELKIIERENEKLKNTINTLLAGLSELLEPRNIALNFFTELVSEIPEVEEVYVTIRNETLDIWTVISNNERNTEWKVFEAEGILLETFPELRFDFLVIPKFPELHKNLPAGSRKIYSKQERHFIAFGQAT
ncbi:MAG: hypothetical protein ACTSP1_15675 [Candidatus Freyarchaeota archaeon]